jgi:hypothetical protein
MRKTYEDFIVEIENSKNIKNAMYTIYGNGVIFDTVEIPQTTLERLADHIVENYCVNIISVTIAGSHQRVGIPYFKKSIRGPGKLSQPTSFTLHVEKSYGKE